MQYSLFTHGTALVIETPESLAEYQKVGWGTWVRFLPPEHRDMDGTDVWDESGPGSWFHVPLPSTLTTFGHRNPRLSSVTILFETEHCRITDVHVYDGAQLLQTFKFDKVGSLLKGSFIHTRDNHDIDPNALSYSSNHFANTIKLNRPHPVFSAVGISFYACAYFADFDQHGRAYMPDFDGPMPSATLTVAAAGAQFLVEEPRIDQPVQRARQNVEGKAAGGG